MWRLGIRTGACYAEALTVIAPTDERTTGVLGMNSLDRLPDPSIHGFSVPRVLAVGLLLVLTINFSDTFITNVVGSSLLSLEHFPMILMMLYVPLVLAVNPALRWMRLRALSAQESTAVMAIGIMGSSIPSLVRSAISYITSPFYFASAENQWPDYVLPHLPKWAVVGAESAEAHEAQMFYEGLRSGETVPWAGWFVQLVWWTAFIGVVLFACVAIAVLLRRQWDEHERLPFPMPEVVASLAEGAEPVPG